MQFSYQWLKELSGTKRSPARLVELLLTHAFEVESLKKYEHGLDDIIIGRVLTVEKHPGADRLRVVVVEVGKDEKRSIVCGASNVAPGQKVAVVLPGGKLPRGSIIYKVELRGVQSEGMICSAKELGLGESHTSIFVLDTGAPVGHSLPAYLRLNDWILDMKILPDRSDALSYEGMAREIAALEGFHPLFLSETNKRPRLTASSRVPKITLKTEKCSRYLLALFQNVKRGESSFFLQQRLLSSGIRPINTIVDITQYVMLQTGQPLHAFDADAIGRGGIVVREARAHERLTLLNGKKTSLSRGDIVIADTKHVLALAGIMGGKRSGITEKTTTVAIEIANFDPASIRKTRLQEGLATEASYRFERGLDNEHSLDTLTHLVSLIEREAGGEYVGGRDVSRTKVQSKKILCHLGEVEKLLGTKVPLFEIVKLLALLGLGVKKKPNRTELIVTIPPRRPDLHDETDLIEEIGRMRGYGKILPLSPLLPLDPTPPDPSKQFERKIKTLLFGSGLDEVMTYPFYGEASKKKSGLSDDKHLSLENPMNPEQAFLRTSLLPGLFSLALRNLRFTPNFSFFEVGSVFEKGKSGPVEKKKLGLLHLGEKNEPTFFSLKGKIETFLASLGIVPIFEPRVKTPPLFHPTRTAVVLADDKVLGILGELSPDRGKESGLSGSLSLAELDMELLSGFTHEKRFFKGLQRFPYAYRDISLIGPKSVSYAQIYALLMDGRNPLLVEAKLFDVYSEGEEKSYAFHLAFGLPERTIKSEEMDTLFDKIVEEAKMKLGFRLRLP